jgi:hypothetical protein
MIRCADQIASSRHGVTPRNDSLSEHIFASHYVWIFKKPLCYSTAFADDRFADHCAVRNKKGCKLKGSLDSPGETLNLTF